MKHTTFKQLLDACDSVRQISDSFPELPAGMRSSHIHVLGTIYDIQAEQETCRVGEVSARMNVTAPGITRLINELYGLGMLEKYPDETDKRITLLRLTADGEQCVRRHILEFHQEWMDHLPDLTEEDALTAIRVIHRLQETMPYPRNNRKEFSSSWK